eukprot:CAMPEP_0203820456 /NCGR_PEP_ID=MMETSP0115-20131106/39940_1 /ASSEMBLY_ACC=CAM_ASM_000227 /TAXON_ID=33651 /ORGANISM="Bicosoecid sp, Strain ms1" /LENGTH=243 /DNA_ID=CAMNT_0050729465 /DNA_START=295 /DNA_END=1021 /DNA_ORIENTATION=+
MAKIAVERAFDVGGYVDLVRFGTRLAARCGSTKLSSLLKRGIGITLLVGVRRCLSRARARIRERLQQWSARVLQHQIRRYAARLNHARAAAIQAGWRGVAARTAARRERAATSIQRRWRPWWRREARRRECAAAAPRVCAFVAMAAARRRFWRIRRAAVTVQCAQRSLLARLSLYVRMRRVALAQQMAVARVFAHAPRAPGEEAAGVLQAAAIDAGGAPTTVAAAVRARAAGGGGDAECEGEG